MEKQHIIYILVFIVFILVSLFINISNKESYEESYDESDIMTRYGSSDVSGTVWVNNSFNVKKEDPGLSWVL